jgi:molecular chaperone GrpE (heat shock protein)
VAYLDALQRGLAHFPPDDPRAAVTARHAEIFLRAFAPCGFARILPTPGDPVDETLHQAIDARPAPDLPPHTVLACAAWGYRCGDRVLARAQVILVAKEQA